MLNGVSNNNLTFRGNLRLLLSLQQSDEIMKFIQKKGQESTETTGKIAKKIVKEMPKETTIPTSYPAKYYLDLINKK